MKVKAQAPVGVTHWEGPPLEAWRPWRPEEAAERIAGVAANWCVVGGWAIDLFLGQETRPHGDLEIAIPRSQFRAVRERLAGFDLYVVGDGEVRALPDDGEPPADKHQNWVADALAGVWRMDVMLEPGDGDLWVFRRDERITAPRHRMVGATAGGVPFLRPQGALLYKAKPAPREKDEADFAQALPRLDDAARQWLRESLAVVHPGHAWLARLT